MNQIRRHLLPGLLLLGCVLASGCSSEPRPESAHAPTSDALKFDVPAGWVEESPSSSSRKFQYRLQRVEQDNEDAEVVVFYFAGGGGTPQANVDRWVGQFQTPDGKPVSDKAKTSHKDVNGIHVTIVDVSGTYFSSLGPMQGDGEPKPGYRMLGVIAETASGPWFIKFTGPERTVARWEPSFHSFVDSMKQ